jgi:hypothetical protein
MLKDPEIVMVRSGTARASIAAFTQVDVLAAGKLGLTPHAKEENWLDTRAKLLETVIVM